MLEEVGAPYRTEIVSYGPAMRSEEFLAINKLGKVPALRHGETAVSETAAICAYLADAFPSAHLAPPPGDERRGAFYRWLFFGAGPFEAAVTNRAFGVSLPAEREGSIGYGSFERVMDTLESAVSGGGYILGNLFSAADVYLGSQIGFGLRFKSIEPRPAFQAYWDRIADRPARRRAEDLDNALMPAATHG
jgi:glutathione S-transferase